MTSARAQDRLRAVLIIVIAVAIWLVAKIAVQGSIW